MNKETKRIYRNLKPVSLKKIADGLEYATELRDYYSNVIEQRPGGSYLKVFYEELYTGDIKKSHVVAKGIFNFLGLELPDIDKLDYHP